MDKKIKHKPKHVYIFKCSWRGTSLRLRIEANDIEAAYRKAEYQVLHMLGGSSCLEITCVGAPTE